MVLKESFLSSLDNSGAVKVKCVHIFSGFKKKSAKLGDFLKISIRKKDYSKIKLTKKLYFGVFLNSKQLTRRQNGHFVKFSENRIILLSDQKEIMGSRILNPIAKEVRYKHLTKIISMSFCFI